MNLITTHKNSDFDALSSVIAATLLYPDSLGIIPRQVNRNVESFLSTHKSALNIAQPHQVNFSKAGLLIVVDTNQWHRLDRIEKLREQNIPVHLWDHHEQQGDIAATWSCIEPLGATTTLLLRELKKRHIRMSPLHATVLLLGVYEDTGHLTYPSTQAEDAEAAAFLLHCGADLRIASHFLNPPYEEPQKDTLFKLMKNGEKLFFKKISVAINIIKLEQKVPMLAEVVTIYRKLINVEAVFIIFINDENSCTIIGRSGSDRINTGEILSLLGGGGHTRAASASVRQKNLDPEALKRKIISLLEESRTHTATVSDLMSFPVITVPASTPMLVVRELMEEHSIRGVLVGSTSNPEGIIVLSDLRKLKQDRQWNSPVKAFMVRKLHFIAPDAAPRDAAQMMMDKKIGHLPVCHNNQIVGIITRTDILSYFYDTRSI